MATYRANFYPHDEQVIVVHPDVEADSLAHAFEKFTGRAAADGTMYKFSHNRFALQLVGNEVGGNCRRGTYSITEKV